LLCRCTGRRRGSSAGKPGGRWCRVIDFHRKFLSTQGVLV
jgi:hypothetical protein